MREITRLIICVYGKILLGFGEEPSGPLQLVRGLIPQMTMWVQNDWAVFPAVPMPKTDFSRGNFACKP